MNIYVGNLAFKVTDDDLRTAFEAFGDVDSARVITDRETGRSKGFGFIEMPDRKAAMKAIESLNGTDIGGRIVTVNESRPRPARPTNNRGERSDRGERGGGGRRGGGGGDSSGGGSGL